MSRTMNYAPSGPAYQGVFSGAQQLAREQAVQHTLRGRGPQRAPMPPTRRPISSQEQTRYACGMLPRTKAAHGRRSAIRWGSFSKALALVSMLALGLNSAPATAAAATNGSLALHSCVVAKHAARCGALMVPEDRLTGTGRQIPLRVVVVPASGLGRLADPIVWVAGGPGDSAVDMIQRVMPLFFFNRHRDLVFVDQRGTGGANGLACPAFYSVLPDLSDKAALRASVAQCLAHLKANLAFYTTAMAADDLNEVLSDLGYAKVNLLGISYGTTAEQVFLMRHPSTVRTMTLLSGTLLTVPVLERFPQSGQDALDTVMTECGRDLSCHRAFPRLSSDWSTLWGALAESPHRGAGQYQPPGGHLQR